MNIDSVNSTMTPYLDMVARVSQGEGVESAQAVPQADRSSLSPNEKRLPAPEVEVGFPSNVPVTDQYIPQIPSDAAGRARLQEMEKLVLKPSPVTIEERMSQVISKQDIQQLLYMTTPFAGKMLENSDSSGLYLDTRG